MAKQQQITHFWIVQIQVCLFREIWNFNKKKLLSEKSALRLLDRPLAGLLTEWLFRGISENIKFFSLQNKFINILNFPRRRDWKS